MNKTFSSAQEAVADIAPFASVAIAGFGVPHRWPSDLIRALCDQGTQSLTIICNVLGVGPLSPQILAENHQIRHLIAAFSTLAGVHSAAEEQIARGKMSFELVPQGTLVERLRAAGAGLPAFYTPVGVGTPVAEGKEARTFKGRTYLLEKALKPDYAFVRAQMADTLGNAAFFGGSQNFGPSFAKAARITIVEADTIVAAGEIPPDRVDLPGIFVDRVVASHVGLAITPEMVAQMTIGKENRPTDQPRTYLGKPALTREMMAFKAAQLLKDGTYVNLGIGIPTLVSDFLFDRDIILHAENGILGYGPIQAMETADPDLYNAGGQLVSLQPGASFFDSVAAFEMARGGHVQTVLLGGFQVDAEGNLANWTMPEMAGGGVGGAMDLVAGGSEILVIMEHTDKNGQPKLLRRCTYPLTGQRCVQTVVTDLAVVRIDPAGMLVEEIAPGFSVEEIQSLTEAPLRVSDHVRPMF
ncbi:MAG: 3-oxoacid CoA-transferase subunit B [Firmicutes bacterium]|nr:3-oxoacid CoA-transferase subunit B [Bacillota bacterium]